MGRKRAAGNERLGQHVQRRSNRYLELRFPVPADVQHAFRDAQGRPRSVIIRALGTTDVNLANAKAEAIKTQLREDVRRARETGGSESLGDFLRWLYDYDLAAFRREEDYRAKAGLRERFTNPEGAETSLAWAASARMNYGASLTSEDPEERRAAASWAVSEYFERQGRRANPASPEYQVVADECARVLIDGVLAKHALASGQPAPAPLSSLLGKALAHDANLAGALSDRGRLPITRYFEEVYAPAETREGAPAKGERNISGKRHTVRLFKELMGNKPVCAISKGDLYAFLDKLLVYPDARLLTGQLKKLDAGAVLSKVQAGEVKVAAMHPKTANKHLSNLSAVLQFAERRRDVDTVDSRGVKARFEDDEDAGRPFTTAELNRIFALPLFAGCAGEGVEGGLFKPGAVQIRDDRFWIPLVLLFTGARSSEIVGMLTNEVVTDHPVPHFMIVPNSVRRLKNKHSRRMVPIHSYLVRMGFLDFVRKRVGEGHERLFPMAEETTYREGATGRTIKRALSQSLIMRQFNRTLLGHANARADRGSTKCFRNTFEQQSMSKIESDEIRQRLTGRKVVSTARIYTDNIPRDAEHRCAQLVRLRNDIECVTYDAVKLDHLFEDEDRSLGNKIAS